MWNRFHPILSLGNPFSSLKMIDCSSHGCYKQSTATDMLCKCFHVLQSAASLLSQHLAGWDLWVHCLCTPYLCAKPKSGDRSTEGQEVGMFSLMAADLSALHWACTIIPSSNWFSSTAVGVHEITHRNLVQEYFSWRTEQAQSLFIVPSHAYFFSLIVFRCIKSSFCKQGVLTAASL